MTLLKLLPILTCSLLLSFWVFRLACIRRVTWSSEDVTIGNTIETVNDTTTNPEFRKKYSYYVDDEFLDVAANRLHVTFLQEASVPHCTVAKRLSLLR